MSPLPEPDMASPGETALFGGRPVPELRSDVIEEIRSMAEELNPESPQYIPEAMFVAGALARHDFSLPQLHFDRTFANQIEHEGTKYREIHVPMVGKPVNLDLAPPGRDDEGDPTEAPKYAIVDGDLCVYVRLAGVDAESLEHATWLFLEQIRSDYRRVRSELKSLRDEAEKAARRLYRQQTRKTRF